MKQLLRRTVSGVVAGAALYLALNQFVGMANPGSALEAGTVWAILAALALSLMNYLLRSVLLRMTHDVPVARTAPIVLADRLIDVIALALLCLFVVTEYPRLVPVVVIAATAGIGVLALLSSRGRLRAAVACLAPGGISAVVIESTQMLTDCASTLVGAISLLPGGLGATEAGLALGVPQPIVARHTRRCERSRPTASCGATPIPTRSAIAPTA